MIRYKTKKQALIIAVLIVILCLVNLTGATLALFTNNPNDGTIGVVTTAGKVKVDVVDTNHVSLKNQPLYFVTFDDESNEKLVPTDTVLFEPGACFYTQGFKIENEGNVSIKFRMAISEAEGVDMMAFQEGFEVWVATDPADMSTAIDLPSFRGSLPPETVGDTVYYLVIRMKTSVGNGFQGQIFGS